MTRTEMQMQNAYNILKEHTDNISELKDALLSIHSAIEHRMREMLVKRMQDRVIEIMDSNLTHWDKLIPLSKEKLKLSDDDAKELYALNDLRNDIAHVKLEKAINYDLVNHYYELVNRIWDFDEAPGVVHSITSNRAATYTTDSPRASYPPPNFNSNLTRPPMMPIKPWYRTTLFYVVTFLLITPVWGIFILTDHDQGWLVKVLAVIYYLSIGCFCCLGGMSLVYGSI